MKVELKEELLKRRSKLVKDREELQKNPRCLYYVPRSTTSFYSLSLSSEYIACIESYIYTEILDIDIKLGI